MPDTRDRLSRPAQGRFFPYDMPHLRRLVKTFPRSPLAPNSRIDLWLVNPEAVDSREGYPPIAALHPGRRLVVYSQPAGDIAPARAAALLDAALHLFRALEAEGAMNASMPVPYGTSVSCRAYLRENNRIEITRCVRTGTRPRYRAGERFANAFRPTGITTEETRMREIEAGAGVPGWLDSGWT